MMENKINQNGRKSVYEPVKVQVQRINPTGVLCSSGGVDGFGASFSAIGGAGEL